MAHLRRPSASSSVLSSDSYSSLFDDTARRVHHAGIDEEQLDREILATQRSSLPGANTNGDGDGDGDGNDDDDRGRDRQYEDDQGDGDDGLVSPPSSYSNSAYWGSPKAGTSAGQSYLDRPSPGPSLVAAQLAPVASASTSAPSGSVIHEGDVSVEHQSTGSVGFPTMPSTMTTTTTTIQTMTSESRVATSSAHLPTPTSGLSSSRFPNTHMTPIESPPSSSRTPSLRGRTRPSRSGSSASLTSIFGRKRSSSSASTVDTRTGTGGGNKIKNTLSRFVQRKRGSSSASSPVDTPTGSVAPSVLNVAVHSMPPPMLGESLRRPRSFSAPLPHGSIIGVQSTTPVSLLDLEEPSPSVLLHVERQSSIDDVLPRELRVRILQSLIDVCIEDWKKEVQHERWKGDRARERWVGAARGWRELVRVSRVSKGWRALAMDGQLWSQLPTCLVGPDVLSPSTLRTLFAYSGTFVRTLDLCGLATLSAGDLERLVELSLDDHKHTRFESVDLTGCFNLATSSVSMLLQHSPSLRRLIVRALPCITHSVFLVLNSHCPVLEELDISLCPLVPAQSVVLLQAPLRVLRMAKVAFAGDAVFALLSTTFPRLEVLDFSYSDRLSDEAFNSLVSIPEATTDSGEGTGTGTGRSDHAAAGIDKVEVPGRGWKRVLTWRHLNLTGCTSLTDRAMSTLSHSLPNLEILELACSGPGLGTAGLVKLFETTPMLRKLDLEDAPRIEDAVLTALLPMQALETLVLSACHDLTDSAIMSLVRSSPKLVHLEADDTLISEATAKAFVGLSRQKAERGVVLSVLDHRTLGRRVSLLEGVRTRNGKRGYWSNAFDYHDDYELELVLGHATTSLGSSPAVLPPHRVALNECDDQLVVVRSFAGHAAIDKADALRRKARDAKGSLALASQRAREKRLRLMNERRAHDDDTRATCLVM